MSVLIGLYFWLIAFSAAEINYETEHVLTVCDASTIWHTTKGQRIPDCPNLPSPNGFFDGLREKLYEKRCEQNESNSTTTTSNRSSGLHLIEKAVWIIKNLVDGLRFYLEEIILTMLDALEGLSGVKSVTQRWNLRVYIILAGTCFLLYHLQCAQFKILPCNIFLGVLTSAVFYFVHLYYQNWIVTWIWIAIAVFSGSPLYLRTKLPIIGAMTIAHLAIPLLSLTLRFAIEVQLLMGPMFNLFINVLSVLVHVVCLIGLYVDEKLLIFKVILLPFYQIFMSLFDHNDKHASLVDSISQVVDELTNILYESTDFKNKSAEQLNKMLTDRLRQLCVNATTSWYNVCPVAFSNSCTTFVNNTDWAKVEQGFEMAGKWLTGLFLPSQTTGSVQRSAAIQMCREISAMACKAIDIKEYCEPVETLYGQAYEQFTTAVGKLKSAVLVQPWARFNFSAFGTSIPDVMQLSTDVDWILLTRHIISLVIVVSATVLLLRAFIQAAIFTRRYKTDLRYGTTTPTGSLATLYSWRSAFKLMLLLKVLTLFLAEKVVKWVHDNLQDVQFVIPELGDARLAFNVQGDGTLARIMKSVLGGFNLQSKYCTKADSSVCSTPFFPVGWPTWAGLFSLAALHYAVGLCGNKSDYYMCRLCDRFAHDWRKKRQTFQMENIRRERQRRRTAILALAQRALPRCSRADNKLILKFYSTPRRWYHRRIVPFPFQSMIAYYKFGVESLECQVCFQDIVSTRFRCKTLLFCDGCDAVLKRCPCGHDSCRPGEKFPI